MKRTFFFLISLFISVAFQAQEITLQTSLDSQVDETSGLIYLEGRLITHNDSGGEAALYEIDENSGNVVRTVQITNASNVDWEDIALDDEYIYIGDFGNNNGNRTDLKIYKISQADYLSSTTVSAEVIQFSYADQSDFTSAPQSTNFDAEGLIAYKGSLYLFTKNWLDNRTHIYEIAKNPGTFSVERIDEFNSNGLITGATFNTLSGIVVLTGYAGFQPFVIELTGFTGGKFSNGTIERYDVNPPLTSSVQIEGIASVERRKYYLSAERNALGKPSLYVLQSTTLSLGDEERLNELVYPNPFHEVLHFRPELNIDRVEIYDAVGQRVFQSDRPNRSISLENLNHGIYIIRIYSEGNSSSIKLVKG